MQQLIADKLTEIEKEHGLCILYACESGSRGWEFPSPDSDYDVRFIYVRPYKYYLSVMDREYDLQFPINGDLDVYGWDLRKVLQLMRKSNTTPFEWVQSPVIYREVPGFRNDLWLLSQSYFSQISHIHHYLGIARGAMESFENGNEIKIKKLFYILRPLLSAKWCLEKQSIAPMTIGPLMTLLPPGLKKQVGDLIKLKATSPESFILPVSDGLRTYIDQEFARISQESTHLKRDQFAADELDAFFVKTITRYDH